jgi:hypothetical protein
VDFKAGKCGVLDVKHTTHYVSHRDGDDREMGYDCYDDFQYTYESPGLPGKKLKSLTEQHKRKQYHHPYDAWLWKRCPKDADDTLFPKWKAGDEADCWVPSHPVRYALPGQTFFWQVMGNRRKVTQLS